MGLLEFVRGCKNRNVARFKVLPHSLEEIPCHDSTKKSPKQAFSEIYPLKVCRRYPFPGAKLNARLTGSNLPFSERGIRNPGVENAREYLAIPLDL